MWEEAEAKKLPVIHAAQLGAVLDNAAPLADPCVAQVPPPRGSNIARRTNCALSAISFFGSEPAAPPTLRKRRASEEGAQCAIRPSTPPLGGLRVDITPKRLNLGR